MAELVKRDKAGKQRATAVKPGGKLSNEAIKKKEREEKAQLEEEKRMLAKRKEQERKEVTKEVAVFNQKLLRVKQAFERVGDSVYNQLRMADENGDGYISLQEFMATLARARVTINPHEILYIYDFIDANQDGKLSYRELEQVVRGQRSIDAHAMIAARRHAEGLDHGYTPSELAGIRQGSNEPSLDKRSINTRDDRSTGSVSMTTVLRRTDPDDRQAPPLTDPAEHERNRDAIRDAFL